MTKAEIFEIKPEVPYSSSDINWKNPLRVVTKKRLVSLFMQKNGRRKKSSPSAINLL
jgi:hypothetical protein